MFEDFDLGVLRTARMRAVSMERPVASPPAWRTRAWSGQLPGLGRARRWGPVEGDAEADEVADAGGAFGAEDLDGVRGYRGRRRRQGVGDVLGDGVVGEHGGGDAALGPAGVGFGQSCLVTRVTSCFALSSRAAMRPAMPQPTTMMCLVSTCLAWFRVTRGIVSLVSAPGRGPACVRGRRGRGRRWTRGR